MVLGRGSDPSRAVAQNPAAGVCLVLKSPRARIAGSTSTRDCAHLIPHGAGGAARPQYAGTARTRGQTIRRTDVPARTAVVCVGLAVHACCRVRDRTSMRGCTVLGGTSAIRPTRRGIGAPHASSRRQTAARAATDAINTVVRRAFTGSAAGKARGLLRRTGSTGASAVVSNGAIGVGTARGRLASRRRGTSDAPCAGFGYTGWA